MIHGVSIHPRQKICNEQGCIYKIISSNDTFFERFGEAYVSSIAPGVIKGWNVHTRMNVNLACIAGNIKLVLFDRRKESETAGEAQEVMIGDDSYALVHIPHGVAFSWKVLGEAAAMIANCATLPYDAGELIKIDIAGGEIPYQWNS
ncbi:MAG: dTDP-4-dehydrorhamnose 3,5-epimerase family protein [bacterium]|nr:dTDP-4-dehydrorhamnose 3,5-epimerase family protein [bacterium]